MTGPHKIYVTAERYTTVKFSYVNTAHCLVNENARSLSATRTEDKRSGRNDGSTLLLGSTDASQAFQNVL